MLNKRRGSKIHEGITKDLYESEEEFTLIQFFKDAIKLANGQIMQMSGKGALNNSISAYLMEKLDMVGIDNHFFEKLNMREQLIQLTSPLPISVCVNNVACSRHVKGFGLDRGYIFETPMLEYNIVNNNYSLINEEQIISLDYLSSKEIKSIRSKSYRINDFLAGLFAGVGLRLVECKLSFGRVFDGDDFSIILIDELTPENLKVWNLDDNQRLDCKFISENPDKGMFVYDTIVNRLKIQKI